MSSREIIKRLKKDGLFFHHVKGSHHQFKHPVKPGKITVPNPQKDFPIGTLKSIFKMAGWNYPSRKRKEKNYELSSHHT